MAKGKPTVFGTIVYIAIAAVIISTCIAIYLIANIPNLGKERAHSSQETTQQQVIAEEKSTPNTSQENTSTNPENSNDEDEVVIPPTEEVNPGLIKTVVDGIKELLTTKIGG